MPAAPPSAAADSDPPVSAVPDVLAPGLAAIFCGINPGRASAAAAAHFANPRNDFWRLLHDAGFTPRLLAPSDQDELTAYGFGLTNAALRTTRGSGDLRKPDFAGSAARLERIAVSCARVRSPSLARRPTAARSAGARCTGSRSGASAAPCSSCSRRRPRPTPPCPTPSGCAGSASSAACSREAVAGQRARARPRPQRPGAARAVRRPAGVGMDGPHPLPRVGKPSTRHPLRM